jgi:glycosyltransferase involved in cell wall biosynthesis
MSSTANPGRDWRDKPLSRAERSPRAAGCSVLYVTLDGLTDPLGRSQVLPYLVGLSGRGHRITVLSAEKAQAFATSAETVREVASEAGIRWVPLRYRDTPPLLSRIWNARALNRQAQRLQRETGFDLVHCRGYIPAAAGLALRRRHGVPFLFDMRGFWPDERVEGGSWPQSNPFFRLIYRHFKALEKTLLSEASHVISLTHEGKRELSRMTRGRLADGDVTVVPCCVDFSHFPLVTAEKRGEARRLLGIPEDSQVLAYLGSIGSWYMLSEMLDFFRVYRERHPSAKFLFVTPNAPATILSEARERGIDEASIVIRTGSREQVPQFMAAADAGIFFIRPVYSKKASSPTKMAELIALGIPVVTNSGVGDVAEIVAVTGCGVTVDDFTGSSYAEAIDRLERMTVDRDHVRNVTQPMFDVEVGVERYDRAYRELGR